jgi:hypothetical protein
LIEHNQGKGSDWIGCAAARRACLDRGAFNFVFRSPAREPNKTMESRKEGRFGRRFPSTPLRTGLNPPATPRLQKFASRNFVLSEPRFQGESKGKIATFYAYILRCSDDSYHVAILTRCVAGTSGPHTGCSRSFPQPRHSQPQRHSQQTLRDISRTHQDLKN